MSKGHLKRRHVIDFAVIVGGAVLLVCVAILLALRSGRREAPLPSVPEVTGTSSEVRVKPVVPKDAARKSAVAVSASRAVAVVCGADEATTDRYEARNDADERTWLTDLIQRTAAFSGVKLMSYSVIMSNHFTYSSTSAVRRR